MVVRVDIARHHRPVFVRILTPKMACIHAYNCGWLGAKEEWDNLGIREVGLADLIGLVVVAALGSGTLGFAGICFLPMRGRGRVKLEQSYSRGFIF